MPDPPASPSNIWSHPRQHLLPQRGHSLKDGRRGCNDMSLRWPQMMGKGEPHPQKWIRFSKRKSYYNVDLYLFYRLPTVMKTKRFHIYLLLISYACRRRRLAYYVTLNLHIFSHPLTTLRVSYICTYYWSRMHVVDDDIPILSLHSASVIYTYYWSLMHVVVDDLFIMWL
jgi:hypothetical protein